MIDIVERLHQPLLQSTTKYQVDNDSQLGAVQALIERLGIRVIVSETYNHLDGLVKICHKATGPLSKPPQKRAAYELIAVLGENLQVAAESVVPAFYVSSTEERLLL